MADMLWSALSYLGAAVLAYHALALLNVLYKTLLASGPKLSTTASCRLVTLSLAHT